MRAAWLLAWAQEGEEIIHWSEDHGIRQHLTVLLNSEELSEVYSAEIPNFAAVRAMIEMKMLDAANRIVSGEAAATIGLDQARKISRIVRQDARERADREEVTHQESRNSN